MRIAVLNECSFSLQNLDDLRAVGDVDVFDDTTTEDEAHLRMAGHEIVLVSTNKCPLTAPLLEKTEGIRLICVMSTGFDGVDAEAARRKGIRVANVPGYSTEAVAEHTFALLLAAGRRIPELDRRAHETACRLALSREEIAAWPAFNLCGKTLGLYGTGAIARQVAKIAQSFGMHVIGFNRSGRAEDGMEIVSLGDLLRRSDVLSLHAPLNAQSRGFVNKETIAAMKDGVVVINTARGGCVVEEDLAAALASGKVGAAGIDVLSAWKADNPLFSAPNVVITPHAAWLTKEALRNLGDTLVLNVTSFVAGNPCNIVI